LTVVGKPLLLLLVGEEGLDETVNMYTEPY